MNEKSTDQLADAGGRGLRSLADFVGHSSTAGS